MKRICMSMIVLLLCLVSIGCQSKEVREPVTLKVAAYHKVTFMDTYGDSFELENSDITFDVIPYELMPDSGNPEEDLTSFINEYQPDILMLGTASYRSAVETGLLLPLDTYMENSQFSARPYPEPVLQLLRNDSGGDQLFGLSPSFTTSALFYNKHLFDVYNVDYPTNGMSWHDVFSLAGQFPSHDEEGNRIYGYYKPGDRAIEEKLIHMIYEAGLGENLSFIDPLSGEVTVHTSSWQRLWETFIHAYQNGIFSDDDYVKSSGFPGFTPQEQNHEFVEGKAAMVVAETRIFELEDKLKELEVQVVEAPGTYQTRMQAVDTFAITSVSEHPDRAWEFIDFVHSEKAGLYHMDLGSLPIFSTQLEAQWDLDFSSLYDKEISLYGVYAWDMGLPDGFIPRFWEVGANEIALILNEDKPIEKSLEDLQAILSSEY